MEDNLYTRTEMLLGGEAVERLKNAHVAVFGIGGVGGHAAEALARAGVGAIDLIDSDKVSPSNINRQIIALNSTVGRYKTEVMEERIHDINPDCKVKACNLFLDRTGEGFFNFKEYDYVIDAIDTVDGKLTLIEKAKAAGTKIICAMGAGNKLDPTKFQVADISKTEVCPLAKAVRTRLKHMGITKGVKTVFSKEQPAVPKTEGERVPASISFVPGAMGLIIAGEVIKDIISADKK